MNLHEAREAIEAILDQIPDHLLPQPKVERARNDKYGDVHWFGGHGYYVGSCRDGKDTPIPNDFRRSAFSSMVEQEYMQRLENAHWAAREAAS